jgi:hypothetical protein
MGKPKATWQDLLAVGGVICGFAARNAEDTLFLGVYSLLGCAFFVAAVRSHKEIGTMLQTIIYCLLIATTMYLSYRTYSKNLERELALNKGALVPAGLPAPLSQCPIPYDAMAIYFGGGASWTRRFPHVVFQSGSTNLLSLDKTTEGVMVTASVFDDRSNLIAELRQNRFVATNYASHFERPDRSTLMVYDHRGMMALKVVYLNDRAIVVQGILRVPDTRKVATVGDKNILISPGQTLMTAPCAGGMGVDFNF